MLSEFLMRIYVPKKEHVKKLNNPIIVRYDILVRWNFLITWILVRGTLKSKNKIYYTINYNNELN